MTCVHSENGRFVVSTTAALSARSATTLKHDLGSDFGQRYVSDFIDSDQIVAAPSRHHSPKL
jgi:hypothetical protein